MKYVFLVLFVFCSSPFFPQAASYEPYVEEEFPEWMLKMQRAQVVAVGSFPFAIMLSGLGYDFYLYQENGFSQDYIPWPPGNVTKQYITDGATQDDLNQKNATIILSSIGISVFVAALDYVLGEISGP